MSKDKFIINYQQLLDYIEVNSRRREMVDWLQGQYEYHLDLASQWTMIDPLMSAECRRCASQWRHVRNLIASYDATPDHTINLLWLGEITFNVLVEA